jgi:ribose 5-phosphate isomerase RpiB
MTPAAGETDLRSIDPKDVDQIVREVLRRLEVVAGAPRESNNKPNSQKDDPKELALAGRVISLADVDGRLSGIATVTLANGSVLTPAARDCLKEHGVTIQRRAAGSAKQSSPAGHSLVLGVAEINFNTANMVGYLAVHGIATQQLARTGLPTVVQEMCDSVALGGQRGVLLTAETVAGVCLANRRPGVRAAGASDTGAAATAMRSIAANLLVIDPAKTGAFQVQRIAEQLCRTELDVAASLARFLD